MVTKTIEIPTKATDIDCGQLVALCNLLLMTDDNKPLYLSLHPESEDEATAAKTNIAAGYISELTNISIDDVFRLNVDTVNKVQLALLKLINDVSAELEKGKTKTHFFIKAKKEGSIIPIKRKTEFYLASDIEKSYPSFVYTQCSNIIEKIIKNPSSGLAKITDLIAFLAYVKPISHEWNNLLTKDVNGNTVYDMAKFNKKKEMFSGLNARDGIRLFNFFFLKQARQLTNEKVYSQNQKATTEKQVKSA